MDAMPEGPVDTAKVDRAIEGIVAGLGGKPDLLLVNQQVEDDQVVFNFDSVKI